MGKRIKSFTVGYFTDATARSLLQNLDGGHPRPAAVHIEPQSRTWISNAGHLPEGENPDPAHHAEACRNLLAGVTAESKPTWDAGLIDQLTCPGDYAFVAAAQHPDIRVMTISSTHMFGHSFAYRSYRDMAQPVVLRAAGNNHDDWAKLRTALTLSGEVYMPGFVRVGEAQPSGEVCPNSQFSGPAFIVDHPREMQVIMGGGHYVATREDVDAFLKWPYHYDVTDRATRAFKDYQVPTEVPHEFPGTSAAAPHAGALIMRHTAGMDGITSYDILPAVLMAAQLNEPPSEALRRVETQSGMIVDPFQYGHGILIEECLRQALRDVWKVRAMSGKVTRSGEYSQPCTVEGRGYMSASTEKAQGPVVNTVLALSFVNDEPDGWKTEARIPEFIMLRSPQGTLIHLPLLYDRKIQYGECVRAGYQTSAFFGEDISKGEWQIAYSSVDENPLRIAGMKIIAHTMHEKSPANVLFKGFQKAQALERASVQVSHAVASPSVLKP